MRIRNKKRQKDKDKRIRKEKPRTSQRGGNGRRTNGRFR